MSLNGISQKVFLDRYALKDKQGKSLEKTPQQMWRRVAKGIAQIENKKERVAWQRKFYQTFQEFKYIPGGRILAGAGSGFDTSYYNCFVLPSPKDSREGILETLKQMVEVMAHGGGVGINISSLRPRGFRVKKVNGFSSGPVNWAELYSVATKDIIQQGGSRRGALMLMLWDWHPDIEEFIKTKQDLTRINGANLSVCVSDKFMKAVKQDKKWALVFPDLKDPDYDEQWDGDLVKWQKLGKKVIVVKRIKARKLWKTIAEAAWRSAEPGVVFMERYNKWHNNWYWNRINCVNPCGEEGLPAWGVCNLGSLNLSAFVKQPKGFKKPGILDYDLLEKTTKIAVHFQDNVVEADNYIYPQIKKTQLMGERRIGLGTMGLGDTLIKLHLRYGSPQSLKTIEKIYKTIRDAAYEASIELAKGKGSFPKFNSKKYLKGKFIQNLPKSLQKKIAKYGIRNSLLLMQAPTGSTSLMAGTTSGIEPVYEFEFIRRDRLGEHIIRHPLYERWLHEQGVVNGEIKKIKKPKYLVGANDLTPEDHIQVQAVIQKYVDASISKTVNAPNNHTVKDVEKIYNLAYKLGLKGIAYMREGSRPGVLSRTTNGKEKASTKIKKSQYEIRPRPEMIRGATYQIDTPVGRAFITINTDENDEPFEVFINVGKAGTDVFAMAEGLGRVISLTLRLNSSLSGKRKLERIVEQLSGIGGAKSLGFGNSKIRSLPDAIAKVLVKHFSLPTTNGNGHVKKVSEIEQPGLAATQQELVSANFDICPDCGVASFAYEEGCKKCYSCGYSECG